MKKGTEYFAVKLPTHIEDSSKQKLLNKQDRVKMQI